jgi:hypothetical protein
MFFAEEIPHAKLGEKVRSKVATKVLTMLQFIERKAADEEAAH